MIQNKTGASVERENFYGRKERVNKAWQKLTEGNSLILAAPRRVGKTSFSKKMMEIAEGHKWKTIYLDVEGFHDELEFSQRLAEKLQGLRNMRVKGYKSITDFLSKIHIKAAMNGSEVEINTIKETTNYIKEIDKQLKALENSHLIIVVDELAIFLNSLLGENTDSPQVSRVERFMNWLRKLRMEYTKNLVWIFCSSIGIENFLSVYEISNTINDLTSFKLDALPREEAIGLLSALAESYKIDLPDEVKEYILTKIDWAIPYYIQLVFSEIHNLHLNRTIEIHDVDIAYKGILTPQNFCGIDQHFKQYPKLQSHQRNILTLLAQTPTGMRRAMIREQFINPNTTCDADLILTQCLEILLNEGYIIRQEERYIFRSRLLKDYWLQKYVN